MLMAQPPRKAMERMEQVKKIKLLDLLDLNEAESEKFLVKYNASEKAIQEKRESLDRAVEALQNRVEEKASKEELVKQSDNVINLQNELQNLHLEKLKSMKSVLNERNYAMFLVFETNFMKELQKHIFDLMKKRSGGEGKGKKWGQEPE
jgi:hypothetical protein